MNEEKDKMRKTGRVVIFEGGRIDKWRGRVYCFLAGTSCVILFGGDYTLLDVCIAMEEDMKQYLP